ncbi:MAG: Si-specific NAD(P)(+) transhydrogenase [Pseudomonadota bacterium]
MMKRYDVVIVGSGPAGEGAAMRLAKAGRTVAVVEQYPQVGGGCTHWGTIPSKALRNDVQMLADYRRHPLFGDSATGLKLGFQDLLRSAARVINEQVEVRNRHYIRNGVRVIHGHALLDGEHRVIVTTPKGDREPLSGDAIILATGSRPYRPADMDFSHPRVLDSDTLLRLDETPRSISIYGAGVIGCEYASIFAKLDVKVNLVNSRDRLLSFLDDEITDALSYYLRELGVVIRHNETGDRVEPLEDGVVLHCASGKKFKTDYLLWANGRSGNSDELGLANLGIEVNSRGQVVVDGSFRTPLSHVYAIGDLAGPPALASAGYDQGRFVAGLITGEGAGEQLKATPTGIYTSPEISSLGPTERELTQEGVPYEVGRAFFKHLARAQISNHQQGMLKLLFHRETREILGIHCFGQAASEIIHIGQAIMSQPAGHNTLDYFINTTFNYPTMAEAYRVAALNGRNRLF